MQKRRFFFKRFREYLIAFLLPVLLMVVIASAVETVYLTRNLRQRGEYAASAIDTNMDIALSNVLQQNNLFANNAYMLLSLSRILHDGHSLNYADAINLRSINASLKSIVTTYSYVENVYLYLDDHEYYCASGQTLHELTGDEAWLQTFHEMDEEQSMLALVYPEDRKADGSARVLTLLQRMPFYDGVCVLRIRVSAYQSLLDNTIGTEGVSAAFLNDQGDILYTWGEQRGDAESLTREMSLREDTGWVYIGPQRYLMTHRLNENFQIHIVTLVPISLLWKSLLSYLPVLLVMAVAGVTAVMYAAYVTTMRNFRNIESIISILADAEHGEYSGGTRTLTQEDEYSVILNNIIRLHLRTEQLDAELEQKRHMQELASLTALQAQINPHFMFNTLQMIQLEAARKDGDPDKVVRMTAMLADILKYALSDPTEPITLREEIAYLKEYVAIQHLRFGEHFIIYYEVDDSLYEMPVFRLMLQPLIENSISHGVRDRADTGYIKLIVQDRGDQVLFRVFDTGVGMSPERLARVREEIQTFNVRNIGLANVNNRLKLYFGEESGLRIRSIEGQGTIVEFLLRREDIEKFATKSESEQPNSKN